jgi:cell division protein FtsA
MKINEPHLIIELNDKHFIFLVVKYNEDLEFKTLHLNFVPSSGIIKGKIVDINISKKIIKENLDSIEKKINFIFSHVTLICDQEDFTCTNISGFKKLSGSQIQNEDILYILNNTKKAVIENQPEKSLVHLFNSNFTLDKNDLDKIPIGLYGELYNQHMTFFLLPQNNLQNMKLVLNNCDIEIERIIFKSFATGIHIINQNDSMKKFIRINIEKTIINISVFENKSFIFCESFPFGSDMILKDLSKVCSLNLIEVTTILNNIDFDKISGENNETYLDKEFFKQSPYRKISLGHIKNIITARLDEIINIIYNKNINLNYIKTYNKCINLSLENQNIASNLSTSFIKSFPDDSNVLITKSTQIEHACLASAELMGKGWEKEAIPIIQTKKSLISRIFSSIFD